MLDEILQERVPPRRHRRNKRGVKRKISSFPVRRKTDRRQPPVHIATTIRILRKTPPGSPAPDEPCRNCPSPPEAARLHEASG
ncbi:MAG: hypothetical protein WCA96_16225 [Methylocella sp.]